MRRARTAGALVAGTFALALALAGAAGCRNEREAVGEEVAELEEKRREVAREAGPGASPGERQEAREELREEHRDVAEAAQDLQAGQEGGPPVEGTDVVRGTVTAVTPEGIRLRTGGGELALGLPSAAEIQASNGHELGREYVVPGAEVRAVYHGADTPSPQIDELWVDTVPGQERLPTVSPMPPALPAAPSNEDRSPPALPRGDPGGRVR